MTKEEVQKRVLHNGEPISLDNFSWDEKTRTFSSRLNNLVIDFNEIDDCTFNTGHRCTFNTGFGCTFNTSFGCIFNTDSGCTFDTGSRCTFKTDSGCTFKTGYGCTFNTDSDCTFDTDYDCTFNTIYGCTFKTGSECVIVRRDLFEVIQPKENVIYRLNDNGVPCYTESESNPELFI